MGCATLLLLMTLVCSADDAVSGPSEPVVQASEPAQPAVPADLAAIVKKQFGDGFEIAPTVDLRRVFAMRLDILGATMGTAAELAGLVDFLVDRNLHPIIDSVYGFTAVADAFARLESGAVFGKVVVDHLH